MCHHNSLSAMYVAMCKVGYNLYYQIPNNGIGRNNSMKWKMPRIIIRVRGGIIASFCARVYKKTGSCLFFLFTIYFYMVLSASNLNNFTISITTIVTPPAQVRRKPYLHSCLNVKYSVRCLHSWLPRNM